jgi:hypothetical protein
MDETTRSDCVWYIKRLSGNDTLANGTHQAGPYIPKDFLFTLFPSLNQPEAENPDVWFELIIDSHTDRRRVRAVWYNNRLRGGTRNETRITQLGGATLLLDPESTGALTVFAFFLDENHEAESCHVWVCRMETEEDLVEERVGPVEPGKWTVWEPGVYQKGILTGSEDAGCNGSCWLSPEQIPEAWLRVFPSGEEIIRKTLELRPLPAMMPDRRLLRRRDCEYELFKSVEEAIELPNISNGFSSIDEFIARAQTILQRRKSRAGRSLELHLKEIFVEEGLQENRDFSHGAESEPGKKPDFIFPSYTVYRNTSYPDNNLRMLAVKTTCKDRWRQILNEADRISIKHLFTLQEGVSENQFHEMTNSNVRLVVPEPLVGKYPATVQPHLQTLESFIGDIRLLTVR